MYFKPLDADWKRKCLDIVAVLSGSPKFAPQPAGQAGERKKAKQQGKVGVNGKGEEESERMSEDTGLEDEQHQGNVGGGPEGGDTGEASGGGGGRAVAAGAEFLSRAMFKILE